MNLFLMQGNEEKNDENEERLTFWKNKKNKKPIYFLLVNEKKRRKDGISGLFHVNLTLVISTIVLGAMYLLWQCMEYAMPNINARVNRSFGGDSRRLARWDGNVPRGNICGRGTTDGNRGTKGDSEDKDDSNPQSVVQSNLRATASEFIPRQVSLPPMGMSEAQATTTDQRPRAMPEESTDQRNEGPSKDITKMYGVYNPRLAQNMEGPGTGYPGFLSMVKYDPPFLPDEKEETDEFGGRTESRFAKLFGWKLSHGDSTSEPLSAASIRQYSPWPEALESPHAHDVRPKHRPYASDRDFKQMPYQLEGVVEGQVQVVAEGGVPRPRRLPHPAGEISSDDISIEVETQLCRIISSLGEDKVRGDTMQPRLDRTSKYLVYDVGRLVRAILHRPGKDTNISMLQFAFRRAADVQKGNLANMTLLMEMLMTSQNRASVVHDMMASLYQLDSLVEMSSPIKALGRAILREQFLYPDTVLHLLICFFKTRQRMALHFYVLNRCSNCIKTCIKNSHGIPEEFYFYDGGGWAHSQWFHHSMIHPNHYEDMVGCLEGHQVMTTIDYGQINPEKAISDFYDDRRRRNLGLAIGAQKKNIAARVLYLPATRMMGTALFISRLPNKCALFYILLHAINMDITPEHHSYANVCQGAEGGNQDAEMNYDEKFKFWNKIFMGVDSSNTLANLAIELLRKLHDGISTQQGRIILQPNTKPQLQRLNNFHHIISPFTSKNTKLSEQECRLVGDVFNQLIVAMHHLMQANRILIDNTKQADLPGE